MTVVVALVFPARARAQNASESRSTPTVVASTVAELSIGGNNVALPPRQVRAGLVSVTFRAGSFVADYSDGCTSVSGATYAWTGDALRFSGGRRTRSLPCRKTPNASATALDQARLGTMTFVADELVFRAEDIIATFHRRR